MAHDLVELRKIFTSALASDCLDKLGYGRQVLNEDINMVSGSGIMLGYAFPVRLESVDAFPEVPYIGLLKALDAVGKDQVYVVPTNRSGRAALWGELLSTACAFKGVAGALADGPTRDLSRTDAMGFKVVEHNVPCEIDGVAINPGDLIVGDSDGVTIVPVAAIDAVVAAVIEKNSGENLFRKAVKEGMSPSAAFAKYGVL